MAASKGTGGGMPTVVRNTKVTVMPPGKLSFSALLKPDDKFGEGIFYANIEMDEQSLDKMATMLQAEIAKLYPQLKEEKPQAPEPVSINAWMQDQVKIGSGDYPSFVKFKVKSEGKKKDGSIFNRTITIWDMKNNQLDLAKLRLGRGSVVQAVVKTGLFCTSLVKVPTPSLQLVGLRILKLVQFGGNGGMALDEVDADDVEGLDMDTDLGAFAKSNTPTERDDTDLENDADPF